LNEPDGQHISGYDPALAGLLLEEAAELTRAIGHTAAHVVLVGGLVPSLLVPVLDPGIEPHVGTADLDLCLSVALVEGDTETYERMEAVLKKLGYTEGDATFRWRRPTGLKLTVELFCPAGVDRPRVRLSGPKQPTTRPANTTSVAGCRPWPWRPVRCSRPTSRRSRNALNYLVERASSTRPFASPALSRSS
jgi:hypothetical protein